MMGRQVVALLVAVIWVCPAAAQVNRQNIVKPVEQALERRQQRLAEPRDDADASPGVVLAGYAAMPADVFRPGPTSGQFIKPANRREPPFIDQQPIQGVSAVIRQDDGRLLGLSDNGFGSPGNSADYILSVYELHPDFRTRRGGTGQLRAALAFELRDPDRHIPFRIVADQPTYPGPDGASTLAVDPRIRDQRLLTGADFDLESFRQIDDGSFVFGDEFGPFLLHTDATGRVIAPPMQLPADWSPQHPTRPAKQATIRGSAGFEGLARQGRQFLAMLEKPRAGDAGRVAVFAYDAPQRRWARGGPVWYYPLDEGAAAIGDFTHLDGDRFLVIERDNAQGPDAKVKRLYLADATGVSRGGVANKRLLADLLAIPDPQGLAPPTENGQLRLPFVTIESVVVMDDQTVGIVNDNNYPFSVGRHAGSTDEPDGTEFVLLRFAGPLR